MTPAEQTSLLHWSLGDETGTSSSALAREACGLPPSKSWGYSYPSDGGDLGRCLKLIEAVPSVRGAVDSLAGKNKYWAALAPHWTRLAELHRADPRAVHAVIRPLIDGVMKNDPRTFRMGENVTVSFGRDA